MKNNKIEEHEIAYKLYMYVNTRKVAIPFDKENDLLIDVYNSWYKCFSDIRELLLSVEPIEENSKVINLGFNLMNYCMRPHLTKYQARFRHWWSVTYLNPAKTYDSSDPQYIQQTYKKYDDLIDDLIKTQKLINEIVIKLTDMMDIEIINDMTL